MFQESGLSSEYSFSNLSDYDDNEKRIALTRLQSYLKERISELERRMKENIEKRSIFDFVDMAVIVGTLANAFEGSTRSSYIKFANESLFHRSPNSEPNIGKAFYEQVRCGLVHEMVPGNHEPNEQSHSSTPEYTVSVTHNIAPREARGADSAQQPDCFHVDSNPKRIVFFAFELMDKIRQCCNECFENEILLARLQSRISKLKVLDG